MQGRCCSEFRHTFEQTCAMHAQPGRHASSKLAACSVPTFRSKESERDACCRQAALAAALEAQVADITAATHTSSNASHVKQAGSEFASRTYQPCTETIDADDRSFGLHNMECTWDSHPACVLLHSHVATRLHCKCAHTLERHLVMQHKNSTRTPF